MVKHHPKSTAGKTPRVLHLLDAHHRLIFAGTLAVIAFFAAAKLILVMRLLLGWDAFALTSVVLATIVLLTKDPYEVRRNARLQDSNATFLFITIVSAASVSLLAVGLLLASAKSLPAEKLAGHVVAAVASIVLSWLLIHILFTLRYAHLYYLNARDEERKKASGGLDFPGEESPTYTDFAYFSFVIGMTCQVSDIQITSARLRRIALVHGLISFCFNTAILAIFVNIIAGLL
jgi:uncharacterized membrane protein